MNEQLETRGEWRQRERAGEGMRRKGGQANKWGVAEGSSRLKTHMVRWKPEKRETKVILEWMKGANGRECDEDGKKHYRQTEYRNGGGR